MTINEDIARHLIKERVASRRDRTPPDAPQDREPAAQAG